MQVVQGDLFQATEGALGHGVNTVGVMGAGIAAVFRKRFPGLYEDYREACRGGFLQPGGVLPWQDPVSGKWIYNIASQDLPGAHARLDWLATGVGAALDHAYAQGVPVVALPRLGAGIGGLQWEEVLRTLKQVERNRPGGLKVYVA